MKGVQVVALADSNPDRLSQAAARFHVDTVYDSYPRLLEDESIDAVLVCTPPALHHEHAAAVLASSRHLYVEPPLALTAEDCDSLTQLGSDAKSVAAVGLNLRFHPLIQRARRAIEEGWVGPVQAISATYTTPSRGRRGDEFPAWRQPQTAEGSVLMEGAVHHFDAWRYLSGAEFEGINARSAFPGGPISLTATMRRGAGEPIVVAAVFSEYAGDNSEIRILGREGTISLSLYRFNGFDYCRALEHPGSIRQYLRRFTESVRSLPRGLGQLRGGDYARTFGLQLEAFLRAAEGREAAVVSLTDGRAATIAALAALKSLDASRAV
jgi:predicted dehydrogenase